MRATLLGDYIIPPCWPAHPGVVEELAGLHRSWTRARITDELAKNNGSNDLTAWHGRWLWPCLRRMKAGHYRTTNCRPTPTPAKDSQDHRSVTFADGGDGEHISLRTADRAWAVSAGPTSTARPRFSTLVAADAPDVNRRGVSAVSTNTAPVGVKPHRVIALADLMDAELDREVVGDDLLE